MHPPRVISASATQLTICVLLSLTAGAFLGGTFMVWQMDRLRQQMMHHPEQMAVFLTEKMQGELDLDAAQIEKIRPILSRHCAEMADTARTMHIEMRKSFGKLENAMRPVLTDQQWEVWLPHIQSRVEWLFPVEERRDDAPKVSVSRLDASR